MKKGDLREAEERGRELPEPGLKKDLKSLKREERSNSNFKISKEKKRNHESASAKRQRRRESGVVASSPGPRRNGEKSFRTKFQSRRNFLVWVSSLSGQRQKHTQV